MIRRLNLLGAPGVGKSTIALKLAGELKERRYDVEYVSEYCKTDWVYENKVPTPIDQLYIGNVQIYHEVRALRHNQFIVTDSPSILAAVYSDFYNTNGRSFVGAEITKNLKNSSNILEKLYPSINFLIPCGQFQFDPSKRIQNEEESRQIQFKIMDFLGYETAYYVITEGYPQILELTLAAIQK